MGMPSWLENIVFYEIYPQSFLDTDGVGNIQGIIRKLDYIKDLGCDGIWLNPCFASPFYDAGYDVADYKKVAPRYGTNEDLKELFQKAHEKGMKVLLDLLPQNMNGLKSPAKQKRMNIQIVMYGRITSGMILKMLEVSQEASVVFLPETAVVL